MNEWLSVWNYVSCHVALQRNNLLPMLIFSRFISMAVDLLSVHIKSFRGEEFNTHICIEIFNPFEYVQQA